MVAADHSDVFKKGTAISTWQCAPDPGSSNWTKWARSRWPFNWFGIKRVKDSIDDTPDFWNRYQEDIANAKKLGCNSFRFSLEWARIEPKQGQIDQSAIKRFNEIFDCLERHGMEASVSLHHFVHPAWFDDLGGWEREENIKHFVSFAELAFREFGTRATMWNTLNEPTSLAVGSCVAGNFPPGRMFRFFTAGRLLVNLLKAHVATYQALKALPGGDRVQVGLTHAMFLFRTAGSGPLYWPAQWACWWATHCMGWDIVDEWMRTGRLEWSVPLWGVTQRWQLPDGKAGKDFCDMWGIQFYSRPMVSWYLAPVAPPGERMSLMPYSSDAEGLYAAIKHSSGYGVPIYITETGFPTHSAEDLQDVLDRYILQVLRAVHDGLDCRGIYIWTLVDNFEWAEGYTKPFGMYSWEPHKPALDRQLKDGARILMRYYRDIIPSAQEAVRQLAKRVQFDRRPVYADIVCQAERHDSKPALAMQAASNGQAVTT